MKKMKSILALLIALAMAACSAASLADTTRLGNDKTGYITTEHEWFDFVSSNLTAEEIANLEASFGYTQYASLDLGFMILTMVCYDNVTLFGDTFTDQLQILMESDYESCSALMKKPTWEYSTIDDAISGCETAIMMMMDEDEEPGYQPIMFVYIFPDDGTCRHLMFENLNIEDEALLTAVAKMFLSFELN